MAKRKSQSKWMQQAVKKPGAFTEYCKRQGFKGVTQACIEKAKKSKNPKTRRRAILAETFRKVARGRKPRKSKR